MAGQALLWEGGPQPSRKVAGPFKWPIRLAGTDSLPLQESPAWEWPWAGEGREEVGMASRLCWSIHTELAATCLRPHGEGEKDK
jgi:hypothetical protein